MPDNYLETHQSRDTTPAAYEMKLAGAIEEIFGRGIHDLPGLLTELDAVGIAAPDGAAWTEDSFTAEMQRLGA
ncbi:MAG: hypothetical protein GEU97_15710 [Actinophytocola sp.]|nr:hypothetical protein [Actinophytocola sp.]